MLTRTGAHLAGAGLVAAVAGAAAGRDFVLLFGLVLVLYATGAALAHSLAGTVLRADGLVTSRDLGLPQGGKTLLLGRELRVTAVLENNLPAGLARVTVRDVLPRSVRSVPSTAEAVTLPPFSRLTFSWASEAEVVGPACFGGFHVSVEDQLGLFRQERFFPTLDTVHILPLPVQFGGEVARGGQSRLVGRNRLVQKGLGSDLHEIRPYLPGDPLRMIAWKAIARTGRIMTREVEAEVKVPCTLLVDASPGMKAGRFGRTKLDFVLQAAAAVAAAAVRVGDPCGLGVFSDRDTTYIAPGVGRGHLHRLLRALAAAKESLYGAETHWATLALLIQGYLHGLDRTYVGPPTEAWRPEAVYDWVARDYSLGPEGRLRLDTDEGYRHEWLLRFCRDRGIVIPAPPTLTDEDSARRRDEMLLTVMKQALLRARERELFVVLSDFEGSEASPVLLEAFRLARARHHSVLLVSPFTPWFETSERDEEDEGGGEVTVAEAAEEMYTLVFLEERAAFRHALRRVGIPVRDLAPERAAGAVLEEVARIKRDRAVRR